VDIARGIVLRLTDLTDTSWIVTWLTEEHGLIKTVAKGAKRPKSKFSGLLDVFYFAEFSWVKSRSSELHTLTEVSLLAQHQSIRQRYVNFELATYFTVILERVLEPDHRAVELFDLLTRALAYLSENPANLKALHHFEKELAKLLGLYDVKLSPSVQLRRVCGKFPENRSRCLELLAE